MKVDQVTTSDLGQMIGIPTIGTKRVTCVKFGYSLEGLDLDGVSDSFKHDYCESCRARKPREASWKWTFEWEKNKGQEYDVFRKPR